MTRSNRVISIAALVGFLAAALAALCVHLIDLFSGGLVDFLIVICPASLLLIPLSHIMQTGRIAAYLVWLVILCLNAGIYAVIAAFIVGLLGPKDAP